MPFLSRVRLPKAPTNSDGESWNTYYQKFMDILEHQQKLLTREGDDFTVIQPRSLLWIAEYWIAKKPFWVNELHKNYPDKAFEKIWKRSKFKNTNDKRMLWLMFLSLGLHPKKGPTASLIQKRGRLPFGLPEDTPVDESIKFFHYPDGFLIPATQALKYLWNVIQLAKNIHQYKKKAKKTEEPKYNTDLIYHAGFDVASEYSSQLVTVLFTIDMPGIPEDLANELSHRSGSPLNLGGPKFHKDLNAREEIEHEEERVKIAVETSVAVEREAAQREIDEYRKSLDKVTSQLDEQNKELRMATARISDLTAEVAELVQKLKICEEDAKKRGDLEAISQAEINREHADKVFSDINSLTSSVARAVEDNTKALSSSEGIEERGSLVSKQTRNDLLAQIRRGTQLKAFKAESPEEKREASDNMDLAEILSRAMQGRRPGLEATPFQENPSVFGREYTWSEKEMNEIYESVHYRLGNGRTAPFVFIHHNPYEYL